MAPSRWRYRVFQFARALNARPSCAHHALVRAHLSADEQRLFYATSPRDQRHHVETLRILSRSGEPSRELARAALLHDVGKGYIRLHERVLYVLLAGGAPGLLARLTRRDGPGTRGALYRIRHHARTGAAALRSLGASPRELDLIARHHAPPGADRELARLIDADERA